MNFVLASLRLRRRKSQGGTPTSRNGGAMAQEVGNQEVAMKFTLR